MNLDKEDYGYEYPEEKETFIDRVKNIVTSFEFFLISCIVLSGLFITGLIYIKEATKEATRKDYCGIIHSVGYDQGSSGYKSSKDPVYWIIQETNGKFIRIHVKPNTYYKLKIGQSTCFSLTDYDLRNYGN